MRSARAGLPIGLLVLALASLALLGCAAPDAASEDSAAPAPVSSSPDAARVLTVPEAIQAGDQPMNVRGYVLIGADGVARLCTGLAGSYPPQCGQPSLVIKGLEQEKLAGREAAGGVVWAGEATYRGVLEAGVFTVS